MSHSSPLDVAQSAAVEGRLNDLRYRQNQLRVLHSNLRDNTKELLSTIALTNHLSDTEAHFVLAQALQEVRIHYDALDLKKELQKDFRVRDGQSNKDRRVAYPLAYLIPHGYTLVFNVVSVLSCAIEAGSCLVIELPTTLNASNQAIEEYLLNGLDQECFTTTKSRPSAESLQQFLVVDQTWQSGNTKIGRFQLLSAPQTRAVAIIDRTADIEVAARELISSRLDLCGQSPQAVDAILINEFVLDKFVELLSKKLANRKTESLKSTAAEGKRRAQESAARSIFVQSQVKQQAQVLIDNEVATVLRFDKLNVPNKVTSKTFVIYTFKSLDQVIDAMEDNGTLSDASCTIFAELPEANYLSRFISASATYINAVPRSCLVGPAAILGVAQSLSPRYERAMFERASPQYICQPAKGELDQERAARLLQNAIQPLKATGQPNAGQWDFFIVGFFLGVAVYVLPAIAIGVVGIKWAFSRGLKFF